MGNKRIFIWSHLVFCLFVVICSQKIWPMAILTIAQLSFIPVLLRLVIVGKNWFTNYYYYFAIPAYLAVAIIQIFPSQYDGLFASIYLVFTMSVAIYGVDRFFQRGFTHFEEFAIDSGFIYLALGGFWYFAYYANLSTGFSPLITWLTAIHFHYSAFILPIFIGFIGRIHSSLLYRLCGSILLISPMIVAIGITFSRLIEVISVLLYIISLYSFLWLIYKGNFHHRLQKFCVFLSFATLCMTIIFSLLYALGNMFANVYVTIDFMLIFHGIANCVGFALIGLVGWGLDIPEAKFERPQFPSSSIRGKFDPGAFDKEKGLIDQMNQFEPHIYDPTMVATLTDFYEQTNQYRLYAVVKWHRWFKPFAFVYKGWSRMIEQINLPFREKGVEMIGSIKNIPKEIDGRDHVYAWVRKIGVETVFVALYSTHTKDGRTYMNIALPLPFSSMHGILAVNQKGNQLQLTSRVEDKSMEEAGIYLAFANRMIRLPIEEEFIMKDEKDNGLQAIHRMWICKLPFLTIYYQIKKKDETDGRVADC